MNPSTRTPSQRSWKEHTEAWKSSGISQQAYCNQESISFPSFVYQHNRLMAQSKKTSLKFIEAKAEPVVLSTQALGLHVVLPNGIRIEIDAEVNPVLLQTVLRIAGAVQCLS
jgi:hypothetical protein